MNHFNKDNALELLDGDEELLEILLDAFLETEFSEEKLYGFIDSRRLKSYFLIAAQSEAISL